MYDDRTRGDGNARKLLELAPTLAFERRSRHHDERLFVEVRSMKEDNAEHDLDALLRDALNNGLESPRGAAPILQLRTMPLEVQAGAIATRDSVPGLAPKLAPESVAPKG